MSDKIAPSLSNADWPLMAVSVDSTSKSSVSYANYSVEKLRSEQSRLVFAEFSRTRDVQNLGWPARIESKPL